MSVKKLFLLSVTIVVFTTSAWARPRISGVHGFDQGTISESASGDAGIDVVQNSCDARPESFFDTYLGLDVVNDLNFIVTFTHFSVKFRDERGRTRRSRAVAPIGIGEVSARGKKRIFGIMLQAREGAKSLPGGGTIAPETGIRSVTVQLRGVDARGRSVSISARGALSFKDFDRC